MDSITSGLILLTYKGKVLLMHKQNSVIDQEKHPWSFISGVKNKNEPLEKTIGKRVRKETGITVEKIEYISEFCYYASLTDDNVNNIKRDENQLLDFFNPRELSKLFLSKSTQDFVNKHIHLVPVL